jgi:hypothetical protein
MTRTSQTLPAETGGTEITRFNGLRHGVLSRYMVLHADECQAIVAALVAEHASVSTFARNIRRRKRGSMSNIKLSNYQVKQSRIVEGVCVPISNGVGDYDELLREAVRVALRIDMNPARDDWDDLYVRIRNLMAAYTASPEGEGEDACILMTRLAICVADVIPMTIREGLITPSSTGATPQTQLPEG